MATVPVGPYISYRTTVNNTTHNVPLPAGIPFAQQQLDALHIGQGVIPLTDDEMAALAGEIRQALAEGV